MDALLQFGIRMIQSLQTLSPALDSFMNAVTFLGRIEFYLVLIPFLYWTIDRRIGVRTLLLLITVDFFSSTFKLLFHQPRPYWISEGVKALSQETSYGIPSSHASNSLAVGGYLGARARNALLWVIVVVLVFLIGLSRPYLGVHFPHDVLFGWLLGFVLLWAFAKWEDQISNWIRSESLPYQIGAGFIASIIIVFIGFMIRFLISGIADPAEWSEFSTEARSVNQFLTLAGALFGTVSGYALMRQYARFKTTGAWGKRLIRYAIGIVGLLLLYFGLDIVFGFIATDESFLGYVLRYVRYGTATFWATFLAPWVFIKARLADIET
jgi:membrane-associated phospholipid phosphatase